MKLVLLCFFCLAVNISVEANKKNTAVTELPPDTGYQTVPKDYNHPLPHSHRYTWLPVVIFSAKSNPSNINKNVVPMGAKLLEVRNKFKHRRKFRCWRRRKGRKGHCHRRKGRKGRRRRKGSLKKHVKHDKKSSIVELSRAEEEVKKVEGTEKEKGTKTVEKVKSATATEAPLIAKKGPVLSFRSGVKSPQNGGSLSQSLPALTPTQKSIAFLKTWLQYPQPLEHMISNDTWRYKVEGH